ncbi:MAG: DUF3465 domain-containing protein [Kiritimatiellae bacterium]|nr:DUF3465 domain-containing protein [Kiritimatiellia bacterium]
MKTKTWIFAWAAFALVMGIGAVTHHWSFRNGYPTEARGREDASARLSGRRPVRGTPPVTRTNTVVRGVRKITATIPDPCFFADFKNRSWIEGRGTVKKVLPDDINPPRHQRLLVADPAGRTVLIANNIDKWERLKDVKQGDEVIFRGEYIDNERGGVVHWTHPDPAGRKPGGGGWILKVKLAR